MTDDAELQLFRSSVNCAAVLEGMVGGWRLDVRESTRRALKYRRGKGEVLIVTHDGRGWWDPHSQAKGDIFDLVQYLDRGLNFGQVRQVLRQIHRRCADISAGNSDEAGQGAQPAAAGALGQTSAPAPRFASVDLSGWRAAPASRSHPRPLRPPRMRFARATTAAPGLPIARTVPSATSKSVGADYKGALAGGHKTMFRFGLVAESLRRLTITEGPIDALSLAALEGGRPGRRARASLRWGPAAGWGPAPSGHCRRCWPGSPPSRMPSS